MFSTESAVIVPLIMMLLVITLSLLHFVAVLDVFELIHSRVFMLDMLEKSEIDGKVLSRSHASEVNQHVFYNHVVYTAEDKSINPFQVIWGNDAYELKSRFYLFDVKRQNLSFLKNSFDLITE